jgi:hypothetical protein
MGALLVGSGAEAWWGMHRDPPGECGRIDVNCSKTGAFTIPFHYGRDYGHGLAILLEFPKVCVAPGGEPDKYPELREEYWQNVLVSGEEGEWNQSLERAGRIADFIELGELMCRDYNVPFLGSLPLDIRIREQTDSGRPSVVADPEGKVAEIYRAIARKTAVFVAQQAADHSSKFPSISIVNT